MNKSRPASFKSKRALALISGGLDSPVASFVLLSQGFELLFIHFDNGVYEDRKNIEKIKKLIKKLSEIFNKEFKLYIINFEEFHRRTLSQTHKIKLHCVLCKRAMLMISEKIALKEKINFLLTGDNLGQVASQTLRNLRVIDSAVKIPVMRPLLFFDKQDIVNLAEKIGTYEISIIRTSGCGAVPDKPATKSSLKEIIEEEKYLDIDEILNEIVDKVKVIELS